MSQALASGHNFVNFGKGGVLDDAQTFTIRGIVKVGGIPGNANVWCNKQLPGTSGWTLRQSDALGNIEIRKLRATTNFSWVTNNAPFSSAGWYYFVVTVNLATGAHIYTMKIDAAVQSLTECTYGTATVGTGTMTSDAANDLHVGGTAAGSGLNCVVGNYLVFAFEPGQVDTLQQAKDWLLNPIQGATGSIFSWLGAAAAVTRSVGSAGGRDLADIRAIATELNGRDLLANAETRIYNLYPDSRFDLAAAGGSCIFSHVLIRAVSGSENKGVIGQGVHIKRIGAPAANEYFMDVTAPGLVLSDFEGDYDGSAVANDAIQCRWLRIDVGAVGFSECQRIYIHDMNTVRAGASVVGISIPGGKARDCFADNIGVGQDAVSSRRFSCGTTQDVGCGFYNCTAGLGNGDGIRLTPNGANTRVFVKNCMSLQGSGVDFRYEPGGTKGTITSDHNASRDGTATFEGGTGNLINIAAGQVVALPGDLHLVSTSVARGAGAQVGHGPRIDIDLINYSADSAPDIGGAQWPPQFYTQNVGGSSTAVGAMARAASKADAGSSSGAGAMARAIARSVAGAVTSAGAHRADRADRWGAWREAPRTRWPARARRAARWRVALSRPSAAAPHRAASCSARSRMR
jgi:hypothetical protein